MRHAVVSLFGAVVGALEAIVLTLVFLAGCALVAYGVALVYLPAGLIVGGLELAAGAVLYARGSSS